MATKNISRSIIEGGRASSSKYDRRQSNQTHRIETRTLLHIARTGDDPEGLVMPKREPVRKEFADKLAPVYRWMRSHVGQRWADVYSKLRRTFDTRTTAGRHIIFDHVLSDVSFSDADHKVRPGTFLVDSEGLLQISPGHHRWPTHRDRNHVTDKAMHVWADGRRVADYGVSLFWMVPEEVTWRECGHRRIHGKHWYGDCYREHRTSTKRVLAETVLAGHGPRKLLAFELKLLHSEPYVGIEGKGVSYFRAQPVQLCRQATGAYRQGVRFSIEDLAMWNRLAEPQQDALRMWMRPVR